MRQRVIKPGFFKNEVLGALAPLTRILFQGLWCCADRAGRLEDRPARIKAEVLPYDSCDTDTMLNDLQHAGLIMRYVSGGMPLIWIIGFSRHQHLHRLEPESELPPYEVDAEKSGKNRFFPDPCGGKRSDTLIVDPDPDLAVEVGGAGGAEPEFEVSHQHEPDGTVVRTIARAPTGEPPGWTVCADCAAILQDLNDRTCRMFPGGGQAGTWLHNAHLRYGAQKVMAVVRQKVEEWAGDPKFHRLLRPLTLFKPELFDNYVNTLTPPRRAPTDSEKRFDAALRRVGTPGGHDEH